MKPRFIQINCCESGNVDLRQAQAVLKYKPDAILFEYPNDQKTLGYSVNQFEPKKKPLHNIRKLQKSLRRASKNDGWVSSDIQVFENIISVWKQGHQILLYNVDAPFDLVSEWNQVWKNMYPSALRNWLWWVRIFLRELYMTQNIRHVLKNPQLGTRPTILVFLQSFHWKHVQFLLSNPSKKQIWNYYFGSFPNFRQSNAYTTIARENKLFAQHWKKLSPFANKNKTK
jgi:hypothetical protein